jgi:hypothetical protein
LSPLFSNPKYHSYVYLSFYQIHLNPTLNSSDAP